MVYDAIGRKRLFEVGGSLLGLFQQNCRQAPGVDEPLGKPLDRAFLRNSYRESIDTQHECPEASA
ncbi:MAG: hypothetical protein R3C05_18770 [Pirellulaceae bacterium]